MAIAIAERRVLRLVVLCALYVAQGIPYGFVAVTLAAYLAKQGAGADEVGNLVAVATLPWAFKWVWGPLVDRFSGSRMGRRRPWILMAQVMMVATAAALVAVDELRADLGLLAGIVLAHNIFASLQDVAVDGLAVDLLPENERGFANGLMYGSSYLGTIIGGAGLSTVLGSYGLRSALVVQVVALTAIMLLPILVRERRGDAGLSFRGRGKDASAASFRSVVLGLVRGFSNRPAVFAGVLAVLVMVAMGALTAIATVLLMQRLGWTQAEYGQMMGGLPLVFGLSGSIFGGYVADRMGHRRVVAAASILVGLAWLSFAFLEPYWHSRTLVVTFACTEQLFLGTLSAALFALFMGVSSKAAAATQFTAYMALLNLSRTIGAKLAGPISAAFTTAGAFMLGGAFQIALVILVVPIAVSARKRSRISP